MKRPLIVGLTGSIGSGKSTVARELKRLGAAVFDADAVVHGLLGPGGAAVKPVARLFPAALRNGAIDRKRLGAAVFGAPLQLRRLEKALHPLVRKEEERFIKNTRKAQNTVAVLDIPLLFETGADKRCDVTVCVTAPRTEQKRRVLRRPGMTEAKFHAILKRQIPDAERKARAGYVIRTGKGRKGLREKIVRFWNRLENERNR